MSVHEELTCRPDAPHMQSVRGEPGSLGAGAVLAKDSGP